MLTIGLPLAKSMDLRQFTGVIAHELGHFTQGMWMRLGYVVRRINQWFLRLAYGRSGIDDVLDSLTGADDHWTFALVGLLAKLTLWITRLIIRGMALLSHGLTMHLSRQAEFDADRQAATIVGSEVFGDALQAILCLDAASESALKKAQSAWVRRKLPDDLMIVTDAYRADARGDERYHRRTTFIARAKLV